MSCFRSAAQAGIKQGVNKLPARTGNSLAQTAERIAPGQAQITKYKQITIYEMVNYFDFPRIDENILI
jgi:hypothetical protein